nr:MAG TPA: hypothetical protein [Caudoviricetes sp.]
MFLRWFHLQFYTHPMAFSGKSRNFATWKKRSGSPAWT